MPLLNIKMVTHVIDLHYCEWKELLWISDSLISQFLTKILQKMELVPQQTQQVERRGIDWPAK